MLNNLCREKIGFFIQKDCSRPAVTSCSICGKPICEIHSATNPATQLPCCLSCLAELEETQNQHGFTNSFFGYGSRRRYYRSSGYQPLMFEEDNFYRRKIDDAKKDFDPQNIIEDPSETDMLKEGEGNLFDS